MFISDVHPEQQQLPIMMAQTGTQQIHMSQCVHEQAVPGDEQVQGHIRGVESGIDNDDNISSDDSMSEDEKVDIEWENMVSQNMQLNLKCCRVCCDLTTGANSAIAAICPQRMQQSLYTLYVCVLQKVTSLHAYSSCQLSDFLNGPNFTTSDLQRLCRKLHVFLEVAASKASLTDEIVKTSEGPGGAFRLLNRMHRRHLHAFLQKHWGEIRYLNKPVKCGYGEDHAHCTKHVCILFILWAWDCQDESDEST